MPTQDCYGDGIRAGHINCQIHCAGSCDFWGEEVFDTPIVEAIKNPYSKGTAEYKLWNDGCDDGYADHSAYFDGDF